MEKINNLPPQQLSFKKKNKEWRKRHLDFADNKSMMYYEPIRKSIEHKKINYDLVNGIVHRKDMDLVVNPENIDAGFIPEKLQHYPIINSKLFILRGEEAKRVFDFHAVVTNPMSITEIEENKKNALLEDLRAIVENESLSEEEFNQELEGLNDYYTYEWQDFKEITANDLLNHYIKELNVPLLFNNGFMDGLICGEEIYQCDIVGGEPTISRVNPMKIRILKSGYSNRIEDADMIIIEDYLSPGQIIDTYYDVLTEKDRKHIENYDFKNEDEETPYGNASDLMRGRMFNHMVSDVFEDNHEDLFSDDIENNPLLPYDMAGNIRVLKVYWKSRRKIKKVKQYDPDTGEITYNFYPEDYVLKEDEGEEEKIMWVNEAWEGVKIGTDIYVNMRPRPIQYNRLGNPSKCHFGIIGSIYNLNDSKPFSLVDMMKPYSYYYDAIHDRLNKLIARNWGKIIKMDLATVPDEWDIDKWMYYAKTFNLAVVNSFNAGKEGPATGKLAGALNNNSNGVIDAELGNSIQQYINLLEFIKLEMSEISGISKQREGQISNRETVGGVERATLQSSHITEWLFTIHDDIKRRALQCLLDTAVIAKKGTNDKFSYITHDYATKRASIDGDEFSSSEYGIIVDNSNDLQELKSKLDMLMQAAIQSGSAPLSTIMKMYTSVSMAEKERMLEKAERDMQARQEQAAQAEQQNQQQIAQMQMQTEQMKMDFQDRLNQRDNDTKVVVAEINAQAKQIDTENPEDFEPDNNLDKEKLLENMRQFDEKIRLEREKMKQDDKHHQEDLKVKRQQANKPKSTTK